MQEFDSHLCCSSKNSRRCITINCNPRHTLTRCRIRKIQKALPVKAGFKILSSPLNISLPITAYSNTKSCLPWHLVTREVNKTVVTKALANFMPSYESKINHNQFIVEITIIGIKYIVPTKQSIKLFGFNEVKK